MVTAQSFQITRYELVVTHPAAVLYVTSQSMVEMWLNFQPIRFVNEHVRILGGIGQINTLQLLAMLVSYLVNDTWSLTSLSRSTGSWAFEVTIHVNSWRVVLTRQGCKFTSRVIHAQFKFRIRK